VKASDVKARDVAAWMLSELKREKYLYQEQVVFDIEETFGEKFTYVNDKGNPAIGKDVLKEFRELSGDSVVWERGERMWRFREGYDNKGRLQD
jgi:hypothetical protein